MVSNDVMAVLGAQWCHSQSCLIAEELVGFFRQKTQERLGGALPSVARAVWNRAIVSLLLEVNLPEDMYEQSLCGNRNERLFDDFYASAGNEVRAHLLPLAEDVRSWEHRAVSHHRQGGKCRSMQQELFERGQSR